MPGAAQCTLVHQAFLYGSPDEFVASMAPFVREGLERGETVFAATKPENIAALREELGDDAGRIELQDTAEWATRPYERLQAFRRLVDELPDGGALRAMGEPVWDGSGAVVRQWARYESIINLALADAPMRFVCLYHSAALPDDVLGYALLTHPERMDDGSPVPCAAFVAPEHFLPGPWPAPPEHAAELPIDGVALRRSVTEEALRAGLGARAAEDLVLAANEVATNALMHGRPPIRAHVWAEGGELVCRIADSGSGLADPLAGWVPPGEPGTGGWGLVIARQVCDAVEIVPTERGTVVSLHVSLHGRL